MFSLPRISSETSCKSFSLPREPLCRRFSLSEIKTATKNFDASCVIGQGGFGKVYLGSVDNESCTLVAIKRLDSGSNQGAAEFRAEIEMLSKLRHCHLVSLIGYCNEEHEMILVYEYVPNGNLESHLRGKAGAPLPWLERLKICIGAARGLEYLHTGTGIQCGVIHRDVKSSNILLDEHWAAKIADFGLSKIGPTNQPSTYVNTGVKGTFGYVDPVYFSTGRLTRKSDVYAFGVILFEVLCGRPALDTSLPEEQWAIATWAPSCIADGKLLQIVDSSLKGHIFHKCLNEYVKIAGNCLHILPKQRPSMAELVVSLEHVKALQERADNSVQYEGIRTITRMVQRFFLPLDGKTSGSPELKKTTENVDGATGNHTEARTLGNSKNHNNIMMQRGHGDLQEVNLNGQFDSQRVKIYKHAELSRATSNFSLIEDSTSGDFRVYKGWINPKKNVPTGVGVGKAIIIRCFHLPPKASPNLQFLEELTHPNLVSTNGYCLENSELLCVYEYLENGSLERHLFNGTEPLPWIRRLNIAIGAARGLTFLHTKREVSYRQFKTSVILLDEDFNAKLSEFEPGFLDLAGSSYLFKMDAYYAAPEWYAYHVANLDGLRCLGTAESYLTAKSEVYSFGVVLLELLTGKKVYDSTRPQGTQNLVKWALPLLPYMESLEIIVDPHLKHDCPPESAFQFALVILKCLQPMDEKRPWMEEVLHALIYDCS